MEKNKSPEELKEIGNAIGSMISSDVFTKLKLTGFQITKIICPVCKETCYDIQKHALSQTDDEHKTLAVLGS
jgi:hypothetical protein